ncbi:hypothetical protein VIRA109638_03925 [Vibrio rarus]
MFKNSARMLPDYLHPTTTNYLSGLYLIKQSDYLCLTRVDC